MFDVEHSRRPETDQTQTTPEQKPTSTRRRQRAGDLTHIPIYTQAWGNQPPPWLRLPVQRKEPREAESLQERDALPTQRQENTTGLPDTLKASVESLSGIAMDDVKIHYNSSRPAQLRALAYTQGTEIHVGPGQEQHLPHEAWHAVQQKQGRVKPTLQAKGVEINDDKALESEADVMGERVGGINRKNDVLPLTKGALNHLNPVFSPVQLKMPKGPHKVETDDKKIIGEFTIDAEEKTNQKTGGRGLNTQIFFALNEGIFYANKKPLLSMIQIVKTTRPTGALFFVSKAREALAVTEKEAPGAAGWGVDIPHEKYVGQEKKTFVSPSYGMHVEVGGGEVEDRGNGQVVLGDFPSATAPLNFSFETSVRGRGVMYGNLSWGFSVMDGGNGLEVGNEYARAASQAAPVFSMAVSKHEKHYGTEEEIYGPQEME